MSDNIHVFDDVLPVETHKQLYDHIKKLNMSNEWSSVGDKNRAWHWNYVFHNSKQFMPAMDHTQYEALKQKHPHVAELWNGINETAKSSIGALEPLRIYMNCNPFGTNGYIHKDDGDMTAIYYPCTQWEVEWEGGTCFYKEEDRKYDAIQYVSYRPNRLVIFDAKIPHRAMPVDRICNIPRYIIAMKLQWDVEDPGYLEKFYAKKS